jgi:hypothetical protein
MSIAKVIRQVKINEVYRLDWEFAFDDDTQEKTVD